MRAHVLPRELATIAVVTLGDFVFLTCSGSIEPRFGPPVAVTIEAGQDQSATVASQLPTALAVKVVDARDRAVPDQPITFVVISGGGNVSPANATTGADGIVSTIWTLGTSAAEAQTVEARIIDHASGQTLLTATFHATAQPGPPTRLAFVTPPSTTTTNGQRIPTQPIVQLQDKNGNPVRRADAVVQITQIAGSGPASLQILNDTTKTNSDGVATFTGTTINGTVGDGYRLGFATPTTSTLISDPISLLRGQPYALAIRTPAAGASRGSAFSTQPVLQAVDAGGNPTPITECVNASITLGADLTGSTQTTSVSDTFSFASLGVSSTSNPGTFTITYRTGCCAPDAALLPASQQIEIH